MAKPATKSEAPKTPRTYEPAKVGAVSTAVPMPAGLGQSKRGGKSAYPFDSLTEVGASFPVLNKTASQMSSVVNAANKRNQEDARDESGNIIFKTQDVKQADGSVVKTPTLEPEKVPGRVFAAGDVDPKTDPDGATCRVWRIK